MSKKQRETISLAIRTINDTLRHVTMRAGERAALMATAEDLRAILKAPESVN